jgi:hypothetical protein
MFRGARDTGAQYQRHNQPELGQESLSSLLNAFHHNSQPKGNGLWKLPAAARR